MRIEDLAPGIGAKTSAKRKGRGIGSGLGKTAGKGHKGQWARSGGGVRKGFEGGQMPLTRTLPKHGFTNNFSKEYSIVNVGTLEVFDNGATVDAQALIEKGILNKTEQYGLKILGAGKLTKSLTVVAQKFTKTASDAIAAAGGKAEVK